MKIVSYEPDSTSSCNREHEWSPSKKISLELNLEADDCLFQEFTNRTLKGFLTFLLMTDDQNQSILSHSQLLSMS